MKKCISIFLGTFFGYTYICLAAFYLSYAGVVKDVPGPMGFLIMSLVPLSVLALPVAVFSCGLLILVSARKLIKKEELMSGNYYVLLIYVVLSFGFLIAVIGMNGWKLIPVKI